MSSLDMMRGTHTRFQPQTRVLEKACTDTGQGESRVPGGEGWWFLGICVDINKTVVYFSSRYDFCEFGSSGGNPPRGHKDGGRIQEQSSEPVLL